ncbi:MAG: hypothetical protein M8352_06355 [ANME-2 cluster archaeon]|nr:hypothetical protein [ANME-2 cluster archaeon]MDF1532307.1 hypothetical protein [ANME-2 cluster archaeon]
MNELDNKVESIAHFYTSCYTGALWGGSGEYSVKKDPCITSTLGSSVDEQ